MQIQMPEDVKKILSKLNKWGYEGYIVGGCVRDCLMGITPSDWDITTSATPDQAKAIFRHTADTGIAHGTITVVINRENYELTTYRIDGKYLDNRHPESVMFSSNLNEDLSRRDFTINAIAYNDRDGLVDPWGGADDIKIGMIKCVRNADERFKEDALRILRALRFAAQLGFGIENRTYGAILNNAHLIKKISIERVRDEFRKILMTNRPEYIGLLADTGIAAHLDDTLGHYLKKEKDIINMLPFSEKNLSVRLALLFIRMKGSALEKTLKLLRFENNISKAASLISEWAYANIENDYYSIRKTLKNTGADIFLHVLGIKVILDPANIAVYDEILNKLKTILKNGDCVSLKELKIDGNDLKDLGIKDGREIGNALEFLLDDVLRNPSLNSRETLRKLAAKYM